MTTYVGAGPVGSSGYFTTAAVPLTLGMLTIYSDRFIGTAGVVGHAVSLLSRVLLMFFWASVVWPAQLRLGSPTQGSRRIWIYKGNV